MWAFHFVRKMGPPPVSCGAAIFEELASKRDQSLPESGPDSRVRAALQDCRELMSKVELLLDRAYRLGGPRRRSD